MNRQSPRAIFLALAALVGVSICAKVYAARRLNVIAPVHRASPALLVPDAQIAPVPADPHELATGAVETPDTPRQISDAFALLDRARANMTINRPSEAAVTAKISFTSLGQDATSKEGKIEDTQLPAGKERWSAQLGNYSILRIFDGNVAYDVKSPGPIPLRIQTLSAAIYAPFASANDKDLVRTKTATWDGTKVTCLLLSHTSAPAPDFGRGWNESEYCIDPRTHLLQIYSEAPGIYVVYDYRDAANFHDQMLPRHITIFEAGAKVLDAHVDSIADAGALDPATFTPAADAIVPGALLVTPAHAQAPGILAAASVIEPMIVHASVNDEGAVLEEEPLQTYDPALSQMALDLVKRARFIPKISSSQPGQRDMYIEVDFLPKAKAGRGGDLPGSGGNHK